MVSGTGHYCTSSLQGRRYTWKDEMKKIGLIASICIFVSASTASADDAARRALAEQLIDSMQMEKTMENPLQRSNR